MPRAFPTSALATMVALTVSVGCDSTTRPSVPRMEVVSATGVSDTILAVLPDPLVVAVRDEVGMPALGVAVRFEVLPPPYPSNERGLILLTTPTGGPGSGWVVTATTDAQGQARVYLRLGPIAGPAQVVVDAPTLGLATTVTYTVLPGAPTGVRIAPADSAVYLEGGYNLRGAVIDRWGNARPDPVTYTATARATVDVDAAGRATGRAIGRGAIIVASGAFRDTAWMSVVPEGVIVAHEFRISTADTATVAFMGLDGSGYEERPIHYWADPHPDWAPSGNAIVMEDGGDTFGDESRLVIVPRGQGSPVVVGSSAPTRPHFHPQYSPDGAWIYFAGTPPRVGGDLPNDYGTVELWRMRADGSGAERVGPQATYYNSDTKPSISPDGNRVVFVTNRLCCDASLMILHLDTKAVDTLRSATGGMIVSHSARWSPVDDDLIAYVSGRIWLTNAGGTAHQPLTPAGKRYAEGFDWSPDGRWIIARSVDDNLLHVIEVSTGLTLPLGFTQRLAWPAWRP